MKKRKREFPYQIHLILGLIWIFIGVAFYSGMGLAIWVSGGLAMTAIGFLNKKS